MSYCVHLDKNKKWFLILVESPKQGLDGTKFNSEKYQLILSRIKKRFRLSLYHNGANSYLDLVVNGVEMHKFEVKDSEIVATPLYLENMLKEFSVDNMKKTGLNGYAYDFSVACDAI